jgi:hypothetical protein
MSTINVSIVNGATDIRDTGGISRVSLPASNPTQIKDSGGTSRLTLNTTDPVVVVGSGSNIIKARNTAKWWIACNGFASILSSFGVASLTDLGSNVIRINYSTATTGGHYAAATSVSHAGGLSWNGVMNNSGGPTSTDTNYRFSYNDGGAGYSPFAWSAIGFGDQA